MLRSLGLREPIIDCQFSRQNHRIYRFSWTMKKQNGKWMSNGGGKGTCFRVINQREYQILNSDVQIVTTGISHLPRRDRANDEMCFNCTLLIAVHRSPSSISVHHFRKTILFLSRFHKLCNKQEQERRKSVMRQQMCALVDLVKYT